MKILTISSLYPNNRDPKHGIFVETRLKHLRKDYPQVSAVVIAPVPWFPFSNERFGEYSKFAGVVDSETRDGVEVYHPKYLVIPKLGMHLTPWLMARSIRKCIKRLIAEGHTFDLIDGHYFYPDGVAIAKVAAEFSIPFTCTARGTDINLIPQYPVARQRILDVFAKAKHLMAVCKALAEEMIALGAPKSKVTVLRNGVDLELFKASDDEQKQQFRKQLPVPTSGPLLLSVGWLIERKGHYLVIAALAELPDAQLVIAGNGPDLAELQQLAQKLGVSERVHFTGALAQNQLSQYYQAADALILASSREGWANVLLEAMASGTAVVATNIWGTPEVVAAPEAGILVERTSKDIANGVRTLLAALPNRASTRRYAEQFTWKQTSSGQFEIFSQIIKTQSMNPNREAE